jgi:hypothetical protein
LRKQHYKKYFRPGQSVVITNPNSPFYNEIGYISEKIETLEYINVYRLIEDITIYTTSMQREDKFNLVVFHEDDLELIDIQSGKIIKETPSKYDEVNNEFDFTKYLDEKSIQIMANKVCEEKLNALMDKAIHNRMISIVDEVLIKTANLLSEIYKDDLEEDYLKLMKKLIRFEDLGDKSGDFIEQLNYNIAEAIANYLKNNPEIFKDEIEKSIHFIFKETTIKNLSYRLNSVLNTENLIREILNAM